MKINEENHSMDFDDPNEMRDVVMGTADKLHGKFTAALLELAGEEKITGLSISIAISMLIAELELSQKIAGAPSIKIREHLMRMLTDKNLHPDA